MRIRDKIESALPFVLPVLGGTLGVSWVNLNPGSYINPVVGIVGGVVLGVVAAKIIVWTMHSNQRKGR